MSKNHGLHIDPSHLLVDIGTLVAYFHIVISEYYECLYCGTERNTRLAVQQHMMAKGHCKYDLTDENAELREFYDISSSDEREKALQNLSAMRLSDDTQLPAQAKTRKSRSSRRLDAHSPSIATSSLDPDQQSTPDDEPGSSPTNEPSQSQTGLSTRVHRQQSTLKNQLAQLRANDRRSLAHLPASQQRALLANQHKQMEKAKRTEQTDRGRLESAGNHFSRLGTTRLIRQPPHFGGVSSLNR